MLNSKFDPQLSRPLFYGEDCGDNTREAGLGDVIAKGAEIFGLGKAVQMAEQHFGVTDAGDPAVNNDIPDIATVTQADQDAHSMGYQMGDASLGDDMRTELERNQVPPQVWSSYMNQVKGLATNALNGREFSDVATACLVRRRNVYKDPQQWVKSAIDSMQELNSASQSLPGEDLYHLVDLALKGDKTWINSLMAEQLGYIMDGKNGFPIRNAINVVMRVLDPNTPLNAQMSELALGRDKMQTARFQFGLGVAALKKNYTELYYENMSHWYRQITEELGPFSRNPIVQKIIQTLYNVSGLFGKAQAVLGATGFYHSQGIPSNVSASAANTMVRTAQGAPNPYNPELLIGDPSSGGSAPASGAASPSPSAPAAGAAPVGFGNEANNQLRNRGTSPTGNPSADPVSAFQRSLYFQLPRVVAGVEQMHKTAGEILTTITSSVTAPAADLSHLGLGSRGFMTEEQLSTLLGKLQYAINEFNEWINYLDKFVTSLQQSYYQIGTTAANQLDIDYISTQFTSSEAKVMNYRKEAKMMLATAQDLEKAWPFELQLIDLDAQIKATTQDMNRIVGLNNVMKRPTNIGLFGNSMQTQVDPNTGAQTGVRNQPAPGTELMLLYTQYGSIVEEALTAYQAGIQRASANGAPQYAAMFTTAVKQLQSKLKEVNALRAQIQYMQLEGKVPQGWSNGIPAARGASALDWITRLGDKEDPENEEFGFWGDLLGEGYEAAYEEAGDNLRSKTVEQALEDKRKRFKRSQ